MTSRTIESGARAGERTADTLTPEQFRVAVQAIEDEVGKVIVGQRALVRQVLITLIAGGNALLEGVPGLGKTALVRALAESLHCKFGRIQFTPDLMPADITGTNILIEDDQGHRQFQFQAGPIFANLVLADEINRATPKTQSALLEVMQEGTVSVAGSVYRLDPPFIVLATQNPLEMEGTYPLPEAQLDRFLFKLHVAFPTAAELLIIAQRTTGELPPPIRPVVTGAQVLQMQALARQTPIAEHVAGYAIRLLRATHPDVAEATPLVRKFVRYGASPRGLQAMVLAGKIMALLDGRFNVAFKDIRAAALPALRHRLILNFDGEAEGIAPDAIVDSILEATPND